MRIRSEYPRQVELYRHVSVAMRDGTLLSADIWRPADADSRPVPALLEYLPYRKGDRTAVRDAQRHPWYAGHGYASVRVDLRGSGDSQGVMSDEYSPLELRDACDVIAWLAEQPWCTGSVGMFGISWGGFNALQVAALRPPALRAIVTVCSTDDRYADDVHYIGGALLGIDMVAWATTMLAFTARPPDPARVGEQWLSMWQERLEALEPFLDTWLSHQERDEYWRHGSMCEDWSAIACPVLAVGGWADPYRTTVLRLLEGLAAPVRGLIGPWPHQYPDIESGPGPAIDFLAETLAWWDHWLKGTDNGVEQLPALRSWMQESVPPATWYAEHPGRWVADHSWPSPQVAMTSHTLADLVTATPRSGDGGVLVHSPLHTGVDAGRYFPYGNHADLPPDQREEDGRSVTFDLAVTERTEILGRPVLRARLRSAGATTLAVRLCDVAPDGSSTLVTRGFLNLLKREGMDRVTPVVPGQEIDVEIPLVAIAWAFPPGHRLRVAVSTSYFPWIWPMPGNPAIELLTAASEVRLPVRSPVQDEPVVSFAGPQQAAPLAVVSAPATSAPERLVEFEPETGRWTLTVDPRYVGSQTYPDGLTYTESARERYTIAAGDPGSAQATSSWRVGLSRPGWEVEIEVSGGLRASEGEFHTEHAVSARFNGQVVTDRSWRRAIPRTSV